MIAPVDAFHMQWLHSVADVIQGLGLIMPGGGQLPPSQVVTRKLFTKNALANVSLPAIIVSLPVNTAESKGFNGILGTNERDDWGYPVQVSIVGDSQQPLGISQPETEWFLWRQAIRKAFHNITYQTIFEDPKSGVGNPYIVDYNCVWQPLAIIDAAYLVGPVNEGLFVSACVVWVYTREGRFQA